ncbi:MAG: BlaI/MecI/CopY family transcriptional regulator, partial [Gemmatimonadota bacterium]
MDILYRRGRATAEEVREDLPDAVSNAAVRGMLRLLEEKGQVRHEQDGPRYVYSPARDPEQVKHSVVNDMVRTFFNNSAESAVAAMVGMYGEKLTTVEIERLQSLLEQVRRKGGKS